MSIAPAVRAVITADPIDVAALPEAIGSRADGAVLVFVGRVREMNRGRRVVRLTYEAYEEMAEAVLRAILDEAAQAHRVSEIVAVHRTGSLELGEASVAIAVATPHRADAYAASRHVIEQIKARLPVWKLEIYADGAEEWQPGRPAASGAAAEAGREGEGP